MTVDWDKVDGVVRVKVEGKWYVDGAAYLDVCEKLRKMLDDQRSEKEHRHFFVEVHELWQNLPEAMVENVPYLASSEHMRKHALIATGYNHTDMIDCGTHENALAQAPKIAAMLRRTKEHEKEEKKQEYAIVKVRGQFVLTAVAMSQAYKAMGKDTFRESKKAVLEWIMVLLETNK